MIPAWIAALGLLSLPSCGESGTQPEPERDWVNVQGTFKAIIFANGTRVVQKEWPAECADSVAEDGKINVWVGGWVVTFKDEMEDPSVPDGYWHSRWLCELGGGNSGRYRSTSDSILIFGEPYKSGPDPPLEDAEWLDSGRHLFKMSGWIFERCSDEVVERGQPRPEGCP